MIASNVGVYQRGPFLVRVSARPPMSSRDFERPAGSVGIVNVDRAYLADLLTRVAHFEAFGKRESVWRRINCPGEVAMTLLARRGVWRFDPLISVISAPTLRPDGSLLQRPGYDRATATRYEPCGVTFPEITDAPTREQAQEALDYLRGVFKTFPFVADEDGGSIDEAVFLAAVLTAVVRKMLDTAPAFGFSANVMESGKSLLATCVGLIANGVGPTVMRYPETNEEAAKLALSVLMQGESVVVMDNVDRPIEGDWLNIILSEEKYSGRMLGGLEIIEVPTNITILMTGNNLVLAGDVRTRALLCRIDPDCERPAERTFEVDLREWIPANRPSLVAAALTIMRAYQVNGPRASKLVTPWDRYKRWSSMVRTPLVWLGLKDPCLSLKLLEQEDPRRNMLLRFLNAWWARYGPSEGPDPKPSQRMKASEVIANFMAEAASNPDAPQVAEWRDVLYAVAADRGGTLKSMRLASYLRAHVGRIVEGRRIEKCDEEHGTTLWSVVEATVR